VRAEQNNIPEDEYDVCETTLDEYKKDMDMRIDDYIEMLREYSDGNQEY